MANLNLSKVTITKMAPVAANGIPSANQVAITIQGTVDVGVGTGSALDNIAQALQSLNGRELLTIASNGAQTFASLTALAGAFAIVAVEGDMIIHPTGLKEYLCGWPVRIRVVRSRGRTDRFAIVKRRRLRRNLFSTTNLEWS